MGRNILYTSTQVDLAEDERYYMTLDNPLPSPEDARKLSGGFERSSIRMCPEVRGKRTAHLDFVIRVSDQAATSACSRTSLRRW